MASNYIKLQTNLGDIFIELDETNAPLSAENFIQYVKKGFYDGTIFHRVIQGFMVQGGGFDSSMEEKETDAPIKNEADNGLKNEAMTVSMARTSEIDSATSQFFINLENNDFLNHGGRDFGYAVFGKVVQGQDLVRQIGEVKTGNRGFHADVPETDIIIEKATLEAQV